MSRILYFEKLREEKALEMKPLNKKKLAENKLKLGDLIAERKAQPQSECLGIYDEAYTESMAALENKHKGSTFDSWLEEEGDKPC